MLVVVGLMPVVWVYYLICLFCYVVLNSVFGLWFELLIVDWLLVSLLNFIWFACRLPLMIV